MSEEFKPNSSPLEDRAALDAFRLLALRYMDGLHTDDEARRLDELLASSAEYRDFFVALTVEAGVLSEMLLPTGADAGGAAALFGPSATLDGKRKEGTAQKLGRVLTSKGGKFAIAAAILVAAVGGWMYQRDLGTAHSEVASVNEAVPAIYSTRLESGTTRFTLPNVGYVIAEGPAEFNLLSPMRARLNSGRIKMRVTEVAGRGFVVETPYGDVTDKGTEFGLDVSEKGKAGLVVFEGEVDLCMAQQAHQDNKSSHVERLVGGDGVTFGRGGELDRIMSIVRGKSATFRAGNEPQEEDFEPLIAGVSDNLRATDTKRFYEIVRGGFDEDARAFVDRSYEWNGVDESGLPEFLVGADYILPFNDDKGRNLQIALSLARPASVYILFDNRGSPPKWLSEAFEKTKYVVGLDEDMGPFGSGQPGRKLGKGPGDNVEFTFAVWRQDVAAPGTISLGSREGPRGSRSMYGIVVVPLETTISQDHDSKEKS